MKVIMYYSAVVCAAAILCGCGSKSADLKPAGGGEMFLNTAAENSQQVRDAEEAINKSIKKAEADREKALKAAQ